MIETWTTGRFGRLWQPKNILAHQKQERGCDRTGAQKTRAALQTAVLGNRRFAVAVFIMATTLVEGQNVWNWIHNFFLGMFGWSAYLIAPLLFYVSIMTALDKPIGLVGHKVWQSMLLICLLSGATQVFGSGIPNGNLIEKFLSLFQNGVDGHGGGAVSGLFGLPLLYWFGPTGAKVTMVLLIFVVLMVLTGGTLIGLYQSAKNRCRRWRRSMSPIRRSAISSGSFARSR